MFFPRRWKGRSFFVFFSVTVALAVIAPAASSRPTRAEAGGSKKRSAGVRPLARPYATGFVQGDRSGLPGVVWRSAPSAYRERGDVSTDREERRPRHVPRTASRVARGLEVSSAPRPETPPPGKAAALASRAARTSATDLVVFDDIALSIPKVDRNSQEPRPSLAINDPVIFTTGNRYAELSTDGGKTFSFIDPATAFAPAKSGFCCDQATLYVPSRDLLVWLLQYASDASGNVLRLAVSKGQTNQEAQVWSYHDLTPQALGANFPAGFVLDLTDLGYSDNSLYVTGDAFASSSPDAGFVASFVLRFSLDELAASQFANWDLFTLTDVGALKPVPGATSTMYFLTHPATSAVRLLTLPETASVLSYADVAVTPYEDGEGRKAFCPDPNGVNACGSADDRVSAAWRSAARGEIGVMWNAAQGGAYPLPYTQAAVLRESDGALLDEAFIWSSDVAWQYPSVGVNSRGDIAGTISLAGPQRFVSAALWIADDVNGHSLSPLESELALAGDRSPTANRWGDFFTTRPHSRLTNLWGTVAVADTQQAGGAEPHFMLFGRARDGPTPASPAANFTFAPANPVAGQTVSFRDLSLGAPDSWSWDFGDGRSSTVESPVHSFLSPSTYDVTLTAASAAGSSSMTKPVIVLSASLRAPSISLTAAGAARDPLFDAYDGFVGQTIVFTASETDANAWSWDFGDGTSASGRTVTKSYGRSGTMPGHLVVYGDGVRTQVGPLIGNFTMDIGVPLRPPPSGGFSVSGASIDRQTGNYGGTVGVAIIFQAIETHAGRYLWYFGDGTAGSGKSVTKEFSREGVWTVKMVVYGDGVTTAIGPTVVAIEIDIRSCAHCARLVPFR